MMFFTLIVPLSEIHGSWRISYTFRRRRQKDTGGVDHNRPSLPERLGGVKRDGVHPAAQDIHGARRLV
jgi:hypothetical protein